MISAGTISGGTISGGASLTEMLSSGYEICRLTAQNQAGALGGLFLTGLVGSLVHCSGMCGPFVVSQIGARMEALPAAQLTEWRRLSGAALAPYHLGRATTYSLLGALAASAVGHAAGGGAWLQGASTLLLGLAALILVGMAIPKLHGGNVPLAGLADWVGRIAKPLFDRPSGWRGYALGVVLGFIPCGLLYAALAASASLGSWLAGGLGMLAFTLGTVPMLVAVGVAGQVAFRLWRQPFIRLAPWLLLVNGLVLGMLAGNSAFHLLQRDSF